MKFNECSFSYGQQLATLAVFKEAFHGVESITDTESDETEVSHTVTADVLKTPQINIKLKEKRKKIISNHAQGLQWKA